MIPNLQFLVNLYWQWGTRKLPTVKVSMGWLFATLLSKTDFSFALLLATFEPLEIYQSYIPFWKAQECGINAWEAQGRGCMFILRQASLKMAILLHTVANWRFIMIIAVFVHLRIYSNYSGTIHHHDYHNHHDHWP